MVLWMFLQYWKDLCVLFSSEVIKDKFKIFILYNYFAFKVLLGKIFHIKYMSQSFFKYKVYFGDYGSFFAMFTDLFIYNVYYTRFTTKYPVIIDAGANIGMTTIFLKYLYPKSKIYCYEPDKVCFQYLEKTISNSKLKNIILINAALGAKKDKMKLYSCDNIIGSTGSSLVEDHMQIKNKISSYEVKIRPLSDLKLEQIDLLKLDIEGYEGTVLNHLNKIGYLKKVKNINLEFHYIDANKSNDLSQILKIFNDNNFSYIINSNVIQYFFIRRKKFFQREKNYVCLIDAFKRKN